MSDEPQAMSDAAQRSSVVSRECPRCGLTFVETPEPRDRAYWRACPRCKTIVLEDEGAS